MTQIVDFKAVALGVTVLLVGVGALSVAASSFLFPRTPIENFSATSMGVLFALLPALAGYLSAHKATHHQLFNGVLAGASGTLLVSAAVLLLFRAYSMPALLITPVAIGTMLASVGALAGRYVRTKHGA